jgi:hypothetical protein
MRVFQGDNDFAYTVLVAEVSIRLRNLSDIEHLVSITLVPAPRTIG